MDEIFRGHMTDRDRRNIREKALMELYKIDGKSARSLDEEVVGLRLTVFGEDFYRRLETDYRVSVPA